MAYTGLFGGGKESLMVSCNIGRVDWIVKFKCQHKLED